MKVLKGFILNIGYDETAIGGAFGIYKGKKINFNNMLWGSMFDFILRDFYEYEIKNYRFCTIDEEEVKEITSQILQLFNDFADEFRLHTSEFIV